MSTEENASAAGSPAYIGFWKRTMASFIDTIIVIIVTVPLLFAVYGREYFGRTDPGFAGLTDMLIQVVLPALFAILFWKYRGATPGKMLIGARIVDADSLGAPSTGRLVLRYFAYLVSAIPLMLGFLWIAFDARKQGWHDKLAKTVVIEDEDA